MLEVGPGKGILTRRLLIDAGRVIAVELDERLAAGLTQESGSPRLDVVHGDFMKYDLGRHRDLLILGNLPYYLSSQMLFMLLDSLPAWRRAVLTTQREFARRLLAEPGNKDYAALTVFFDRLTVRERLFSIPATCFKPRPDVVSTAFRLTRRELPAYAVADETSFRRVVKSCFAQRRKTVANNLAFELGLPKLEVAELLTKAGIDPCARAEALAGPSFAGLVGVLADAGVVPGGG